MKRLIIVVSSICFVLLCSDPSLIYADAFEDTATGKAAKELMGGLNNFLSDWTEIQGKPLEQQIQIVREKAAERIGQKFVEQSMGRFKKELLEYTQTRMRADLFKQHSQKMLHAAVVEGKSVSAVWSSVDLDIQKKVTDNMAVLAEVVDGAVITYKVYDIWAKQDGTAALRALGTEVADKIMGYFIPGWGYYRLAQAMIEALGKFVLGYAFDAALEGKIAAIAPVDPKTDPQGFANWVMKIDNISAFVKREWDEQIGYTGWYAKYDGDAKTTDGFGDNMQAAIVAELFRVKKDVLAKERLKEELEARIRAEEAKVREANKAIKDLVKEALRPMEEPLKMLEEFETRYYGLQKVDTQEAVEEATEAAHAIIAREPEVPVVPMDIEGLIAMVEERYSEITDDFKSGYDYEEMIERAVAYDAKLEEEKKKLSQQFYDAREAGKSAMHINDLYWTQLRLLHQRTRLIELDAIERNRSMLESLMPHIEDLRGRIADAIEDWDDIQQKVAEATYDLNFPSAFQHASNPHTLLMKAPLGRLDTPEDVVRSVPRLKRLRGLWESDMSRAGTLGSQLTSAYLAYYNEMKAVRETYIGLIGKDHVRENENVADGVLLESHPKAFNLPEFQEYNANIKVMIDERTKEYYKKLNKSSEYNDNLAVFDNKVQPYLDRFRSAQMAVEYYALRESVDMPQYDEKRLSEDTLERLYSTRDGTFCVLVDPALSDGVDLIETMRDAWNKNSARIEQLKRVRDTYIKQTVCEFTYHDPRHDSTLDLWLVIPDFLEMSQELHEEKQAEYSRVRTEYLAYPQVYKERLQDLRAEQGDARDLIKHVQALKQVIMSRIAAIVPDVVDDELAEVRRDLEKLLEVAVGTADDLQNTINTGRYRYEGTGGQAGLAGGLMNVPFAIQNARLNGTEQVYLDYETVLTEADLDKGHIVIEARISPFDKVEAMEFFLDAEKKDQLKVKKKDAFRVSFKPVAGKVYHPCLRIQTVYGDTVEVPVFHAVQSIRYEDIDFTALVVESIGELATAYEQSDVSAFSQLISREYLGSKAILEDGARFDFLHFMNCQLRIGIRRIERRKELFVAETEWQRMQTPIKIGDPIERSGKTTLMFVYEDGRMRIKNMRGDLLFASLSPDIAQAQGISQRVIDRIRSERETVVSGGAPPVAAEDEPGLAPDGPAAAVDSVESGSFALTQYSTHPMKPGTVFAESFDFARKQVVKDHGFDLAGDFRRREGWIEAGRGAGVRELAGSSLADITEVPASGYQSAVGTRLGAVYALQCADGTFAVIEFVSAHGDSPDLYEGRPIVSQFRYRYQRNGTRVFD